MVNEALRDRVLYDAGDLFYAEGINATGVNRVAERLGISKRTLYELFASKDVLVTESLAARDLPVRDAFTSGAEASAQGPADQLAAIFTIADDWSGRSEFRGCPYLNATAELADSEHAAHAVVAAHKEELRRWMERKARSAQLRRPRAVSLQLMMLFDGLFSQATVGPVRPGLAASAARVLIDAARG